MRTGIALLQHRAERPGERRAEHQQRAERRARRGRRSSRRAAAPAPARPSARPASLRARDALAEQPDRKRHRPAPAWCRRGSRRGPTGSCVRPKATSMFQQVMLKKREQRRAAPHCPLGTASGWPPARSAANSTAEPRPRQRRAEGPRRHLGQRHLHRRPVEAPGERQPREHPPQARRQVIGLGRSSARPAPASPSCRAAPSNRSTRARSPASSMRRQRASTAGSATWPSRRASGKPRQMCAPKPKVRCGTPWRARSSRSGIRIGARVAVGGVHQQEHALARLAAPCRAASAAPARCAPARRSARRSAAAPRPRPAQATGLRAAARSSAGKRSSARRPLARWCVVVSWPAKSSSTQVATSSSSVRRSPSSSSVHQLGQQVALRRGAPRARSGSRKSSAISRVAASARVVLVRRVARAADEQRHLVRQRASGAPAPRAARRACP